MKNLRVVFIEDLKAMPFFFISLIGLFFIILFACNERRGPKAPESSRLELDANSQYYDQNYKIYTLQGCEYIVIGVGNARWGSHKGDCKNPIHVYKDINPIDTTEKHFDCTVESCEKEWKEKNIYWVTTECGMVFQSNVSYKNKQILKNFKSPKHK